MASHIFTRPRYAAIRTTTAVPPSFPSGTPTYLLLRHPGYPDEHNIMVSLPALDRAMSSPDDDGHRWGVHHTTALHVCSVVAANTTGVLSARKLLPLEAAPPLIDLDAVLTARSYYFYPHGWTPDDPPYPVCPDFANWRFPHDQLPADWANIYSCENNVLRPIPAPSQFSLAVATRDGSCRISDFTECLQTVHLVPEKERDWFQRNSMHVYNLNRNLSFQYLTCDMKNCLRMRQDLHTIFDSKAFVLVPKMGSSHVHFLSAGPNYTKLYHNCMTEDLDLAAEFLYARFAWAVLQMVVNFVSRRNVRIQIFNSETMDWETTTAGEAAIEDATARTPTKRRRRGRGDDASSGGGAGNVAQDMDTHSNGRQCKRFKTAMTSSSDSASSSSSSISEISHLGKRPPAPDLNELFDKIVAKDPIRAWNNLNWHPDADRIENLRESYLREHEPLHQQEQERQSAALRENGVLWD